MLIRAGWRKKLWMLEGRKVEMKLVKAYSSVALMLRLREA